MNFRFFATPVIAAFVMFAASGAAQAATTELVCKVTATASASNLDRGPQEEAVGDWVFLLDADKHRLDWKSDAQLRPDDRSQSPMPVDQLDIGPDSIRFCIWPGGCDQSINVSGHTERSSFITIDRTTGALTMSVDVVYSYASLHYDYHGTCNKAPPKPKPKF